MPPITFHDIAESRLSSAERMAISTHSTLERALPWLLGQSPPWIPGDLEQLDEYSYSLIVPLPAGCYLVYDTC